MLKKHTFDSELQDDSLLLKKINKGCKQSFNLLYEKYWETAYISAYKRLRDSEQSKDIVQEIFTYIWFRRETLQIENLPAYIQIAVRNRVLKLLVSQKSSHPFFRLLEDLPQLEAKTDSNILTKEFFIAFEALLNTLPSKKQTIFRLRFQEDIPTKDIARLLGISRKTVQNQLGKAIDRLRISFLLQIIAAIIVSIF